AAPDADAASPAPAAEQLPPSLRAKGAAFLAEKDDAKRAKLGKSLAEKEPAAAADFLIAVLDHDPSEAVRLGVVEGLSSVSGDGMRRALERHAASDSSVEVSLLSLEKLREQSTESLRHTLGERLAKAKEAADDEGLRRLREEDERWISLVHGTMLPSFLRQP